MTRREITGVSMSAIGLMGIIYSAVGLFDNVLINRNPLVGIVFLAMIMLVVGLVMMKPALEEA